MRPGTLSRHVWRGAERSLFADAREFTSSQSSQSESTGRETRCSAPLHQGTSKNAAMVIRRGTTC
jgi:hypothetical protein